MVMPVLKTTHVTHEGDITFVQINPHNRSHYDLWMEKFCANFSEDITDSGHTVIDMASLDWLPQPMLTTIMEIHHQKKSEGHRLILVGVHDDIMNFLSLVKMNKVFEIAENDAEAVNMINGL